MKVEQDQQRRLKTSRSHRTSFPKQRGGSGKEQPHSSTWRGGTENIEDTLAAERTLVVHCQPDVALIRHLCYWEGGRKKEEVNFRVGELGGVTKR